MNSGTKVKYFHTKGEHTDSNGRPYHEATVIARSGRDDNGNPIYVIKSEHAEYERLVIPAQIEKL